MTFCGIWVWVPTDLMVRTTDRCSKPRQTSERNAISSSVRSNHERRHICGLSCLILKLLWPEATSVIAFVCVSQMWYWFWGNHLVCSLCRAISAPRADDTQTDTTWNNTTQETSLLKDLRMKRRDQRLLTSAYTNVFFFKKHQQLPVYSGFADKQQSAQVPLW